MPTPEEFFGGEPTGLAIYRAVREVVESLGAAEVRVGKSQIAFRRRKGFAYVWRPGKYLKSDVPAVLSFGLPSELHSPRFKEVAHPAARVWMHHLELREPGQVDAEVRRWLAEAFAKAA
ncbi:DUF5655 domain-containing protein [Actinoplanes sp. NPDC023714]|uniref:DUF5655 domain-containing protein n=1 Tax=Actinoplanes sp. NPDC023714 TaxID=3154322 RepID=UPI0033C5B7C0